MGRSEKPDILLLWSYVCMSDFQLLNQLVNHCSLTMQKQDLTKPIYHFQFGTSRAPLYLPHKSTRPLWQHTSSSKFIKVPLPTSVGTLRLSKVPYCTIHVKDNAQPQINGVLMYKHKASIQWGGVVHLQEPTPITTE